jgi:hypothetical protein
VVVPENGEAEEVIVSVNILPEGIVIDDVNTLFVAGPKKVRTPADAFVVTFTFTLVIL